MSKPDSGTPNIGGTVQSLCIGLVGMIGVVNSYWQCQASKLSALHERQIAVVAKHVSVHELQIQSAGRNAQAALMYAEPLP